MVAFAAQMMATDLTGIKVYINPGHGGWNEMNDRHIPTIPFPQYTAKGECDTLGFWESSSNLKVAFDLESLLLNANANVLMSRRDNRSGMRDNGQMDYDKAYKQYTTDPMVGDRPFSSIKAECAAYNADMMLSIHSNAASSVGRAANYVVAFIEGKSTCASGSAYTGRQYAADSTAWDMATIVVRHMRDNLMDSYHEADGGYVWSYYHTWSLISDGDGTAAYRPTVLCEASFHSYLPNTHRFLNRDYQTLEAYRFYYAMCEIWNADAPATGILAGDVRSLNFKETRAGMGSYITAPTNHPEGSHDKWMAMDGAKCELMQGGQVLQTYTTDQYCNGIFVFYGVQPGEYQVRINANHAAELIEDVTITAGNTTTINAFVTDSNYLRPLTPDYPNQAADATLPETFTFHEYPVVATPFLDGLNIRHMIMRGEKTYVLDDASHIYVVNTFTGEQIAQVPTASLTGVTLGDIAFTSDSILMASSIQTMTSDTSTCVKIFSWASDDAQPVEVYAFHTMGGLASSSVEGGEHMVVCGNSWWHRLFFTTRDSKGIYGFFGVESMDGEVIQTSTRISKNAYNQTKWGTHLSLLVAPTDASHSFFIADGNAKELEEFNFDWTVSAKSAMDKANTIADAKLAKASYGVSFLQYAGNVMMLVPVCDAGGVNIGLQLFDMATNADADMIISVAKSRCAKTPAAGLNAAAVDFMQSGSVVINHELNLVLYLKGLGMYRYSTSPYTGLDQVHHNPAFSGKCYDLLGRPVDASTRGIHILNGEKIMRY